MLHQSMQVAEQRRKDMLAEAEKQRMLADLRQHEDGGPARRVLVFTSRTLIALGEALTPPEPQAKTEPRVWTDS